MYVDAITIGGEDTATEAQMVSVIRAALAPFEGSLQRVVAFVRPTGVSHVCLLRAWCDRGHTVVVERRATSRDEAVATATDSMKRALERAPAARPWTAPAGAGEVPIDRRPTALLTPQAQSECPVGSERAPHVLLVLHELEQGAASLQWAAVLVESLRARLEVCRLLPDLNDAASLPSGRAWLDATRRALSATRETRAWCDRTLPHAHVAGRAIASMGELAYIAQEQNAEWIVVSARAGCGEAAVALARASSRPVLVARPPTTRHTLLVATEAGMDNHPALANAARLAVALHAPVLVFQDVQGLSSRDTFPSQVDVLAESWRKAREPLEDEINRRPPELDVVLACSGDRVDGILQQARREDAGMIIMSLPGMKGPCDELVRAVVDGALRSVLIIPPHAPEGDRAPPASDPDSEDWHGSSTGIRRARRLRSRGAPGRQRRRGRT